MNRIIRLLESPWVFVATRLLALLAFLGVALLGIQYTQLSQHNKTFGECVAQWGTDYTSSVTIRGEASNARLNALHKLILDAIEKSPGTTADLVSFMHAAEIGDLTAEKAAATKYLADSVGANAAILQEDVNQFVLTEEAFQKATQTHPLPAPPALRCR